MLAVPTALIGPALTPGKAFLPADLLVQFEPWKSQLSSLPYSHWDPLVWDGIAQYYPWRAFAAESLRSGVLPLWNPYQFCGTPFIANGQSAVLYPLNLVFWLLPTAVAFGWSAWLHLSLTGWFAYLFLRRIGTGRVGSVAGAIVWQGNGFLIAWIHLPTVLCTAAWLPLILLLIEKAVAITGTGSGRDRGALGSQRRAPVPVPVRGRGGSTLDFSTLRRSLAAGLALAFSYLGGHPQVFLFVAMLTLSYTVARGLSRGTGSGRDPAALGSQTLGPLPVPVRLRAARCLSAGAITGIVAAGLSSIQLLPSLDFLRIAHRAFIPGPETYRFFLSHAVPLPQLVGLVLPHPFGHPALGSYVGRDNYAEFACYVGIVALALALWAPFVCRTWHARFFGVATLVVFLIALGTPANWPLYHWLPGFARSGGPGRMLVLATFALSVLAGMGVDQLSRASMRAGSGLILALIALFVTVRVWEVFVVNPVLGEIQPGIREVARAEGARLGFLVFAAFLAVALARGRLTKALYSQVPLVAILAVDLLLAAHGHLHISPQAWVYPPFRRAGASAPAQQRILGNAADWPINRFPNALLPPNSATVYHLRDAFGYDSLYLARYRDFAAAIQHGDPSPPLNGNMLLARLGPVYGLDMMSLAGVETVFSPTQVRGLKMETAGAYYTYSNPYARPRAWVASSAVFVPTHADAVASLATLGAMPDTILITGPDGVASPSPALERGQGGEALVRDLSPNSLEITVRGRGGPYLFLADAFAPGWTARAEMNGQVGRSRLFESSTPRLLDLPIRPANVAFRAVALPDNANSVLFRYEPDGFRIGLFVTLVTCAALAAVVGRGLREARVAARARAR